MKWLTEFSNKVKNGNEDAGAARAAVKRTPMLYKLGMVIIAASIALTGCSLLPGEDEEEDIPEITPPAISKKPEYEVTTSTLEKKVQASGKVISMQEETLFYTLEGKRLKELNVEVGDYVEAGTVLAELDVDDLKRQLRSEQLQFRKEEVSMKEQMRNRDSMDDLEFEMLQIDFEDKRQKLVEKQEEVAKATLVAPFSGTIASLSVAKGDEIKSYSPVLVIADNTTLVPAAKFSTDQQKDVVVGMPAKVEINSKGTFEGKVKRLSIPREDKDNNNNNKNIERPEDFLIVALDKVMPEDIARGTSLSISVIISRRENVLVIPPSALRTIGSRTYVQVIDDEGNKREVDVEVGEQTSTEVEIVKGLTKGQKVIGR
jgi:macrolide-specific efflux system membrane fusion protein